jgi:hypothetical protein
MTSFVLVVAAIAFLSGGVAAVFVMLVIGIRKGPRRLPSQRNNPLETVTLATLGANAWPCNPVDHRGHEDH